MRNVGQSQHGVFTKRPGTLSNDFFVNLLDMNTKCKSQPPPNMCWRGTIERQQLKWTGTIVRSRLRFELQLRALAEVYACSDAQQAFVHDFVAAWDKVMNLDRYDLA